eukprot:g6846.t1
MPSAHIRRSAGATSSTFHAHECITFSEPLVIGKALIQLELRVEIVRNKLRAAAVWMDEYEVLVQYASAPLPTGVTLGDLESRKSLRQHLQCKSFKWYLENVAKEVFVPSIEGLLAGSLRNSGAK